MKKLIVNPAAEINGEVRVASDKSISHRALLLSSLCEEPTRIKDLLRGEDILSTVGVLRACGVRVEEADDGVWEVIPGDGLRSPSEVLDCGNSGTLMRLFSGIAVGRNLSCELVGDSSLMRRPMERICAPLGAMGGEIKAATKKRPPLVIGKRERSLKGILYNNRLASGQVKGALLLAGLHAKGGTVVAEPFLSRNHTELMLQSFGASLRGSEDGQVVEIVGGGRLTSPGEISVPADFSSAMFFLVAAAISPGSRLVLNSVVNNPSRTGGLHLLMRMGADIDIVNLRQLGDEPVADVVIRGGSLHGIEILPQDVPSAIDDLPALFVAAAAARGDTVLTGAAELRHKESDRLSTMVSGLKALGVSCKETEDGLVIKGANSGKPIFASGMIDTAGDHRIAMAFCMASTRAKGDIVINHSDNIRTSFPDFIKLANRVGMRVVEEEMEEEEEAS